MTKTAQFLKDLADQVSAGLISYREAADMIGGNQALTPDQQGAVEQAIMDCRMHGSIANNFRSPCGGQAYAYPHAGGGVCWGFNEAPTGFNVARGVRD